MLSMARVWHVRHPPLTSCDVLSGRAKLRGGTGELKPPQNPFREHFSTLFSFTEKENKVESGRSELPRAQVITPLRCGAAGLTSSKGDSPPSPLPSFSPSSGIQSHLGLTIPPRTRLGSLRGTNRHLPPPVVPPSDSAFRRKNGAASTQKPEVSARPPPLSLS